MNFEEEMGLMGAMDVMDVTDVMDMMEETVCQGQLALKERERRSRGIPRTKRTDRSSRNTRS